MGKSSKAISVFVRVGLLVLLLVLLLGVVGMAYSYIGNGQRNFYVQYGNEVITGEKKDVEFEKDNVYVFTCGTLTGQTVSFDVRITLNVKNVENFDFSVDDNRKNFKSDLAEYDCSKLFNLVKSETCFYLSVPFDLTLQAVIQSKYPDKTITDVPNTDMQKENSFILTVTDGVEKAKTQIYFC